MAKREEITNIVISIVLIFIGIFLLIYSHIGNLKAITLLYLVFLIHGLMKIIEYSFSSDKKDKEDLFTGIISLFGVLSSLFFKDYNGQLLISITLVTWVGFMSIIKLIKVDYYHDRNNKMFYINMTSLILFLIIGVLTGINLFFDNTVQVLILGYFFIANGLLNLAEDAIRIIATSENFNIKRKDKKNGFKNCFN